MSARKPRKTDPIPEAEFTGVCYSWRDQHMKEFDQEAAACAAAIGARGKKTSTTTPTEKHDSPPTTDPLIASPSRNRSNDQRVRVNLRVDWSVSFDPPLAPAHPQAPGYVRGNTVFHSPYFSSASGAAAWADLAEWPWSEGERRQWYKWHEEPEKEDEDDDTASSTSSSSPALSRGQRLAKEAKKVQNEEDTKPVPAQGQAAHHRKPGLSYSEVVRRP
ncbi:hypothetical protein F4776DRAFT_666424 [Hypoxylon sp. NC0597]|nr:hypothetical protein F4776DRAFT_666424 [Hypoxylon sp. NC0597]